MGFAFKMGMIKCLVVFFILMNVFLLIIGMGSLGVGVWMAADSESFLGVTNLGDMGGVSPGLVRVAGYVMISTGGATVLLAMLGIIGGVRKSTCLLGLYITLLILALVVQVTAIVLGVIFKEQIEKNLEDKLIDTIREEYDGPGNAGNDFSSNLNSFMKKTGCCGVVNGSFEFVDAKKWKLRHPARVPDECCKNQTLFCNEFPDASNSHTDGCSDKVKELLHKYQAVVIGISAGAVGFQFLLVILGVCILSTRKPTYNMSKP